MICGCLKKRYDFVFSLGHDCVPAAYLKELGIRTTSMPFDWLSAAPLESRVDLLVRRFSGFPGKEDMEARPDLVSSTSHLPFCDRRSGLVFLHDFTVGADFDVDFECVRERYARRCSRLVERLDLGGQALAVYFASGNEALSDRFLIEQTDLLRAAYPKSDINLLVLRNERTRMRSRDVSTSVAEVSAWFYPPRTGFPGNVRVGNRLFRRIGLSGDVLRNRRRVRRVRFLIYALASLVPVKKRRRSMREAWCERLHVPLLGKYND